MLEIGKVIELDGLEEFVIVNKTTLDSKSYLLLVETSTPSTIQIGEELESNGNLNIKIIDKHEVILNVFEELAKKNS